MSPHHAAKANTRQRATETPARPHQCEMLEERLALTVQALTDLPELVHFSDFEPTTEITATATTDNDIQYIRDAYSFDGSGQTIAVIDSGIAWDHYALGGGYGEDFRVVGGWDFAENDANPFDDGPAGFHGTHVAGIIGSQDAQHEGVSSGVDLVGLRVFDDMGGGKLEWVEQALRWVHENRDAYENPITTVNLSLGVDWNADSVPNWATLEDEFAQLKADGIFISVAAGNSFQSYLSKGVSYPAASPHVVPVASHGDDGSISDFSQRNDRVLAAPGEKIESTVPSHIFGQSGPSSRFMAASGTSMAAPYMAGASALLREAFQVAGSDQIDQDKLYEHFMRTADEVYDSVTGSTYSRLNLRAAIDAALNDQHGDSVSTATQLGNLTDITSFDGILAKSHDQDFVKFRADESGRVTLTLTENHDLDALMRVVGENVTVSGNSVSFDVHAGQTYAMQLSAASGQGSYGVQVDFESSEAGIIDLGVIRSNQFSNLNVQGESNFRIQASRNGILTVEALFNGNQGNIQFEIYDSADRLVGSSTADENGARFDLNASRGESFLVKVIGTNDSVDLRMNNLVRITGNRLIVGGTGQQDHYSFESGQQYKVTVNGTSYEFARSEVSKIRINGGTGNDSLVMVGSSSAETLSGGENRLVFYGDQTDVIAQNFENVQIDGNGGYDLAVLNGTAGNDTFVGRADSGSLRGSGYQIAANGFQRITVVSGQGGNDHAFLYGSDGSDLLHIHSRGTSMSGTGFQNYVKGFDQVFADGGEGLDRVMARGTAAEETIEYGASEIVYSNSQGQNRFSGFQKVSVHSGGGADKAIMMELGSSDRISANGDSIVGHLFGTDTDLNGFKDIDWSAAAGQMPDVALAAVEEIYDTYGIH